MTLQTLQSNVSRVHRQVFFMRVYDIKMTVTCFGRLRNTSSFLMEIERIAIREG